MRIAVIGCGSMASIVIRTMAKNKPNFFEFLCYNPSESKAVKLAQLCGGKHIKNFSELKEVDAFFLGVKPQHLKNLDQALIDKIKGQPIISILAAVATDTLSHFFSTKQVLRLMPNTPIENNLGIILELSSREFNIEAKQKICDSLTSSAKFINCNSNKQLDELTTIFGCGPAFIYQIIEVFKSKLIDIEPGFEKPNEMLSQLFKGSASMVEVETINIKNKIDQVTSKAGVTIEGVKVIANSTFDKTFNTAINSALKRSKQISQEANNLP